VADQTLSHPDEVRLLFDAKADGWPAKYGPQGRLAGRLVQLADAAGRHVIPGGRVLDLGCGTGELARYLATRGMAVTGCDVSANMLGLARAADAGGAVAWIRLDPAWRTLPFAPGSFDAVVAASVLEYVGSPCTVLRECARVLRPGGIVLCTVPDLTHPVRWLESAAGAAARVRLVRAVGEGWPRLDRYLTYLRISRQRRSAGWWAAQADQAGLRPVAEPAGTRQRAPLRLFAFERPGPRGGNQ
jgi:SAM-dependent methyltransferase